MPDPLIRILHLEDDPQDAEYIESLLKADKLICEVNRVQDREGFLIGLKEPWRPDLILSDFTLPAFDGLSALWEAREKAPDIPFIFVSGSMGEGFAIDCLKQGAVDYLLKDKLARLPAAIRRALDESRGRQEKKQAEEQLLYSASHDRLTGLTNRTFFQQHLQEALARSTQESSPPPAIAIVGLDDFKTICDGFGWEAGNSLLQAVAGFIRREAPSAKLISRIGGDEFALLFESPAHTANLVHAMEELQSAFRKPLPCQGQDLYLSAGVGMAHGSPHYGSAEEMLRDCENALHHAKASGKSGRVTFDPAMHRQTVALLSVVNELRQGIQRQQFCVHYQPVVDLASGAVSGFEALVRWQHPRRGLVQPLEFIPVAERLHLTIPIGAFVMREACRIAKQWREARPGRAGISISVNVSPQQFEQADLYEWVHETLRAAALDPSALKLEITESGILRNPENTVESLRRLKSLGIDVQIDDFGTGYSSLSYLHRFPVQALKIDRSFVIRIDGNGGGTIATAIIDLAHNLGMQVVAEGIETPEQLAFLKEKGCEYGQGFLFAKPMDEESAWRYLERQPKG